MLPEFFGLSDRERAYAKLIRRAIRKQNKTFLSNGVFAIKSSLYGINKDLAETIRKRALKKIGGTIL